MCVHFRFCLRLFIFHRKPCPRPDRFVLAVVVHYASGQSYLSGAVTPILMKVREEGNARKGKQRQKEEEENKLNVKKKKRKEKTIGQKIRHIMLSRFKTAIWASLINKF